MKRSTSAAVLSWGSFVVAVIGVLVALSWIGLGGPVVVGLVLGVLCVVALGVPLAFLVLFICLSASGRGALVLAALAVSVYLSGIVAPGGFVSGRDAFDAPGGLCSQLLQHERPDLVGALLVRFDAQPAEFTRRWMPAEVVCRWDVDGRPSVVLHTGATQTWVAAALALASLAVAGLSRRPNPRADPHRARRER